MSIGPISASAVTPPAPVSSLNRGQSVSSADRAGFGNSITKALSDLEQLHSRADSMAAQAATGDLQSVTDYVVASTEAQLATQVTAAVRNKAVQAFNDIMRMSV